MSGGWGGGGSAAKSARVTNDGAPIAQLLGAQGYAFPGDPAFDWDDAGFYQLYGARAGLNLNPASKVFVAPADGRYRFTAHLELNGGVAATWGLAASAFLLIEQDLTGASYAIQQHVIVKPAGSPDTTPGGSVDLSWVGKLLAGGCVGIYTQNTTNSLDLMQFAFQAFEQIA